MRLAVATTSCAITAALALLCLTSAPAAEVPLVNGDFEDPALTAEHLPVGWHNPDTGLQPTPNLYRQSLLVHGGRYAAAISDNDNQGYSLQSRLYPALPGQKYTAGAWVYNGTGDGWLYLEFYASPWQRVSEKHAGCGQTGSWQRITLSETCPAEAKYVAVLLYSAVANTGDAAWDDVTLAGPAGDGAAVNLDKSQEAVKLDYSYLYNVGDRKQLLFDDAFFSQHERFWWRVCPPKKTGEHNLVADKPWENFIINWFTVRQDGGKYRMWYEAYDKAAAGDDQARYCYAESKDGIHWVKPVLGLVEYGGSKANNILFDHLGGAPEHGGTVFKDPMAPPQQRYKFIYLSADQERKHWTVWGATSPDGLHWQRHDAGPILNVGSDTQTVAFWDESLSKYVTYCRLWTHSRTIGRSESADFFKFPEAAEVMRCDELDPPDTDLYNNAALKYPYADHAYLIFTSLYHHPSDNLDIQLAVSRDGVHWSRPERKPFIANGPPGSMDDATAYMAPGLVRQGRRSDPAGG